MQLTAHQETHRGGFAGGVDVSVIGRLPGGLVLILGVGLGLLIGSRCGTPRI